MAKAHVDKNVFIVGNPNLENVIKKYHETGMKDADIVGDLLVEQIMNDVEVIVPIVVTGGSLTDPNEDVSFAFQLFEAKDGKFSYVAFTSETELEKGEKSSVMPMPLLDLLGWAQNDKNCDGVVINPWGDMLGITREGIENLMNLACAPAQEDHDLDAKSKAKHVSHIERIEIFNDTQDWIKSDKELAESVRLAKKNTTVYFEDDYPVFDPTPKNEIVAVTNDRSYQAAMRLAKEDPTARIAVMNFANAFHAGGGVTRGASAQEESLCRCSTLYPLIYRKTLRDTFYKHHHTLGTAKASDTLIYIEGVVICKTDEDYPVRMKREDWVTVDVITIAAPDLRTSSNKYAALICKGTYMNDAELFGYHVKRAIHMLTVAAAKGIDVLVLGAFGCGAFRNNPEVVARAYKVALQEFPKVFKKVEFAVYTSPSDDTNYSVFKTVLAE